MAQKQMPEIIWSFQKSDLHVLFMRFKVFFVAPLTH